MKFLRNKSQFYYEYKGLLILSMLMVLYGFFFIWKSSFIIASDRYFALFDDAAISARYAKNWAQGCGLLWNCGGEKVEGYTNFLWTMVMGVIHWLPSSDKYYLLAIQLFSALIMALTMISFYGLLRWHGQRVSVSLWATLSFCCSYEWIYWTMMGMETGFLSFFPIPAILLFFKDSPSARFIYYGAACLGIASLIRPEIVLILAFIWGYGLWNPKIVSKKTLILYTTIPIVMFLCFRLWAYFYYGDILPNTYYLKLHTPLIYRLKRGLDYTLEHTLSVYYFPLIIGVFGCLIMRKLRLLYWLAPFGIMLAYQIWAGGDAWARNRFIIPVLPFVYILNGIVISKGIESFYQNKLSSKAVYTKTALFISLFLIQMLSVNFSYVGELTYQSPLYTKENRANLGRALLIEEIAEPNVKVAVRWAGLIPYYTDCVAIDLLGKSDAYIAKLEVHKNPIPGHSKWDFQHSVMKLKPDIVVRFTGTRKDIRTFIQYYTWYAFQIDDIEFTLALRNESLNIRWNKVKSLGTVVE